MLVVPAPKSIAVAGVVPDPLSWKVTRASRVTDETNAVPAWLPRSTRSSSAASEIGERGVCGLTPVGVTSTGVTRLLFRLLTSAHAAVAVDAGWKTTWKGTPTV